MRKIFIALVLFCLLVLPTTSVFAQDYYFAVESLFIDAYWQADGTLTLDYQWVFLNQTGAAAIEYVDVGFPNEKFALGNVSASVDGNTITDIQMADPNYLNNSRSGVTIGLGAYSIPPGGKGTVQLRVTGIERMVFKYDKSDAEDYASVRIKPSYFGSQYVTGTTYLSVIFHFPPGVLPEEPKWEEQSSSWPGGPTPIAGVDSEGRMTYIWEHPSASASTQYDFAAAFPAKYIPGEALQTEPVITFDPTILVCPCIGLFLAAFFVFIVILNVRGAKQRKLQYLPPKIAIEGHGIKRGLTAVESAILMEQPMDKIMTMILFGTIKKGAAEVVTREPLEIKVSDPLPEGLQPYEVNFLSAFKETKANERKRVLQEMMVGLVKTVAEKLKGFSRKETIAYYESIMKAAWEQVQAANTPEVKGAKFDEVLEWTMLDKDYSDRTRQTFSTGPVILPTWWGHYDPVYRGSMARPIGTPSSIPVGSSPGKSVSVSLPTMPGADFAASMVNGVQSFSAGVLGDLTNFTSGITNKTNPPPPPSTYSSRGSGRSGGGGCACACACAGCACACAGGGR